MFGMDSFITANSKLEEVCGYKKKNKWKALKITMAV